MTIKEKAKAYDEALKRAKAFKEHLLEINDKGYADEMDYIFPELKESEDEQHRKWILEYLYDGLQKSDEQFKSQFKCAIAWLEKQSEQEESPCDKCKKEQPSHSCQDITALGRCAMEKQIEQKPNDKIEPTDYNSIDPHFGKPIDKIEPKFKVGNWITNGIETVQITGYDIDYGYQVDYKGNLQHRDTDIIEKEYHLWTIQDAKDGDILAGKIDGDNYILIFKQVKDGWVETYGHYYDSVDRFCVPSQLFCRDYQGSFTPATKEQRDQLKRAMTNAGYRWNKKELKLEKI